LIIVDVTFSFSSFAFNNATKSLFAKYYFLFKGRCSILSIVDEFSAVFVVIVAPFGLGTLDF